MSLFSYLKSRISILDVINEYTHLKRAGNYWKGHCPFHSEKTGSFTVSPHKEIFYCFGCHQGGDVISFIAQIEHCSQMEAAHHLAERHNIELPRELLAQNEPSIDEKKQHYDLCKLVANWCHEQLKKSPGALHYLLKRGFTKESMVNYQLGYFPGGYNYIKELATMARGHSILVKDLVESGIIQEGKTVLYSAFEDRIIFPIKDHLGRNCGFGGRIFKPQDERPKYYNSRENPYFNKGSLLFGFDSAKKSMQQKEHAFLVEGYADCVAMAQYGYTNTIATLGTACSPEQLKTLSRYIQQLYVVYDSDKAGQEAIMRMASLCWQASLELKVIKLPPTEDPASFLTKGNDLAPLIASAKDIFLFFIESTGLGFEVKSLPEKLQLTRKLLGVINSVEDAITQDFLLQRASKTIDIPFESLKKELERMKKPLHQQTEKPAPTQVVQTAAIKHFEAKNDHKLEKNLFFAILNNIDLLNNDNQAFLVEYLPAPYNDILGKLQQLKNCTPSLDFIQFFDNLDSYEKELVSKILLEFEGVLENNAFDQLLAQFHRKNWKSIVRAVKLHLDQAKRSNNHQEEQKILQNFHELKKKLLALNLP